MVSIIKTAAVAIAVLATAASTASAAPKCTTQQVNTLAETSPDLESCVKYYSSKVAPPSKEVLCKDLVCKASLTRMVKLLPSCEIDGVNHRKEIEEELKYCASTATAPKCTAAQMKVLTDATPDKDVCVKYYSTKEPPAVSVFCKEPVCVASITRLAAILPDCIDGDRAYHVKNALLADIAYCEKKASGKTVKAVHSKHAGNHSASHVSVRVHAPHA